jgi:uncharacterized protein YggE
MKDAFLAALLIGVATLPAAAQAQQSAITQTITGTRLDLEVAGEVTRVPDVAIISAGVVSRSATASGALQDSADRMGRVLAALKRAGVADRDLQTSNISLNPEYRYPQNADPQLIGYTASNTLTVRFRDVRTSGKILDALVAQGANQINGPNLVVDNPQAALDEARAQAVTKGRARADLYARSLGMRVVRLVSLAEQGGNEVVAPMSQGMISVTGSRMATKIESGEQKLQVSLSMTFELQ